MVKFTNEFDLNTFEECLQYIQDSLEWLIAEQESNRSMTSRLSLKTLDHFAHTIYALLRRKVFSLRNASVNINHLPPEILGEIFLHLQGHFVPISVTAWAGAFEGVDTWHFVNLVCRRWRSVALSTRTLWTNIRVTRRALDGLADGNWPWKDLSLIHETLPLSICFRMAIDTSISQRPAFKEICSHAHRFRDLRFRNVSLRWLRSFLPTAPQLELLDTLALHALPDDENGPPCTLPHLQVLSVYKATVWRDWSMGNLRYLNMQSQEWDLDTVRGILVLLSSNPRLEEVMISHIAVRSDSWDVIEQTYEQFPLISMPRLRRLAIREVDNSADEYHECPVSTILNSRLVFSAGCARYYALNSSSDVDIAPLFESSSQENFPVKRLFMKANLLAGSDDTSAFAIQDGRHDCFIRNFIKHSAVEELWLVPPAFESDGLPPFDGSAGDREWCVPKHTITAMSSIIKLVIVWDIRHWLDVARDFFPIMKELQLHTQDADDAKAILAFLRYRKETSHPVEMLRFVREESCTDEAFYEWEKSSSVFAREAGQVVFEHQYSSVCMDLPDVCNPSSVLELWQPWHSHVMRFAW